MAKISARRLQELATLYLSATKFYPELIPFLPHILKLAAKE
jgi:hypothetical protein